jgi:hypothetical protein
MAGRTFVAKSGEEGLDVRSRQSFEGFKAEGRVLFEAGRGKDGGGGRTSVTQGPLMIRAAALHFARDTSWVVPWISGTGWSFGVAPREKRRQTVQITALQFDGGTAG